MPSKKSSPKIKKISSDQEEIVSKVVAKLKPELDKKLGSIRNDIASDVKELIAKLKVPAPNVAPNSTPNNLDINGLMKQLQGSDGQIDMGAISSMMGNMQSSPMTGKDGKPIDFSELSPGQLEFMKMENQNKMLVTLLPLLFQKEQGNPMVNEMMNRIFLEKISSSIYMDRTMMQAMGKMMGNPANMKDFNQMQNNLVTPINTAISQGGTEKQAIPPS